MAALGVRCEAGNTIAARGISDARPRGHLAAATLALQSPTHTPTEPAKECRESKGLERQEQRPHTHIGNWSMCLKTFKRKEDLKYTTQLSEAMINS